MPWGGICRDREEGQQTKCAPTEIDSRSEDMANPTHQGLGHHLYKNASFGRLFYFWQATLTTTHGFQ